MLRDLDTRHVDFIQFTVQVGGRDATRCFGGERHEESLLLLYSNNGGITWSLMKEMQSVDYLLPRYALVNLPVVRLTWTELPWYVYY